MRIAVKTNYGTSLLNEVAEDFKKTNLYSDEFINDLEDGLRKSSYAKTICA